MLNPSDPFYSEFTKAVQSISKKDIVLDIGTSQRFAKEMLPYRDLFNDNYFAFGYNPEDKYQQDNCEVSADILNLPVINSSVDAIICLEVIEHVLDPQTAVNEMYRVLKPHGTVILTTPFLLPYHGKGGNFKAGAHTTYPDFWRFTYQGLQLLFQEFSTVEVVPFSNTIRYYANQVAQFDKLPILKTMTVQNLLAKTQSKKLGNATHRHLVIAEK